MTNYAIGDVVKVELPKGYNNRGVLGVHVMFQTSQEAKFEGATGTVEGFNPRGPFGQPQYLVDFRDHENRVAIPWQAHWFRGEWVRLVKPAGEAEQADAKQRAASAEKIAGAPTAG